MYGVAGSLLGKVLNATETTTLASKWNSKGECYQFIQMKNSIDEKEKELKSQGGRSISERPILKKCCFKIPLQKEEGLYGIKCEFQLPGPGSGLGYQWSPSPPPAHPWFSKRRTRDGRNGRTGTKFCRSLITQIVLSLRPCPPFSFPFQLSLWYIQHYITLKKINFIQESGGWA
jgi:hypothetical protein